MAPYVPCGKVNPPKYCRLWDQSCYLRSDSGAAGTGLCCPDGTTPCSLAFGQCCAPTPGKVCSPYEHDVCCPDGMLLCGYACCTPDEWCMLPQAKCVPRSSSPCGHTVCPAGHTCYSSARRGQGLCCPPGKVACRGVDSLGARPEFMLQLYFVGQSDWQYCCDPPTDPHRRR